MGFVEFLSPLLRRWKAFVIMTIAITGIFYGASYFIPEVQKTTVYFSVKLGNTLSPFSGQTLSLDPVESASKIAEALAGWAKDPGFRAKVLQKSEVEIGNFKRKLTARKQNRINVFWTIKLNKDELEKSSALTTGLIDAFNEDFSNFNYQSSTPFSITTPSIFSEMRTIPLSWRIIMALFLGVFLSFVGIYIFETFGDRVSYIGTVFQIFEESPILRMKAMGSHNPKLLEQFILTFESPRLISTFKGAEKYFQLAPMDSIDEEIDIPILLVRLGHTRVRELENLLALFGDEIGLVVFEK